MEKLGGKTKSTNMTLILVDKSFVIFYGIIKDVLINIENFIYLINFIFVDIEEEVVVYIILDTPFL